MAAAALAMVGRVVSPDDKLLLRLGPLCRPEGEQVKEPARALGIPFELSSLLLLVRPDGAGLPHLADAPTSDPLIVGQSTTELGNPSVDDGCLAVATMTAACFRGVPLDFDHG